MNARNMDKVKTVNIGSKPPIIFFSEDGKQVRIGYTSTGARRTTRLIAYSVPDNWKKPGVSFFGGDGLKNRLIFCGNGEGEYYRGGRRL